MRSMMFCSDMFYKVVRDTYPVKFLFMLRSALGLRSFRMWHHLV